MRLGSVILVFTVVLLQIDESGKSQAADSISNFHPYNPDSEIVAGGLSPNGLFAVAYLPPDKAFEKPSATSLSIAGRGPANCFLTKSSLSSLETNLWLPTNIGEFAATRSNCSGVVKWAKDSSAMLIFETGISSKWTGIANRSPYEIYVIPIVHGKAGNVYNLGTEILKVSHPELATEYRDILRDHGEFCFFVYDSGLEDDLTFNDANLIIIDWVCESYFARYAKSGDSTKDWSARVTGLWDPVGKKFVKLHCQRVADPLND